MKILVVTPTFLPVVGGAELGIFEIYQRLGKRHNVHILTPSLEKSRILEYAHKDVYFKEASFKVYRFDDKAYLDRIGQRQLYLKGLAPPFSLSYIMVVFRYISNFRPDIINFNYVFPGGLALILLRALTKIPVVLSLVGRTDVIGEQSSRFRRYYFWRVVKSSSIVISNSSYYLRLPSNSVIERIIPYGVNINRFSPGIEGVEIRRKLAIAEDKIVLFTLQRLSSVKRVDILIRSLKYILEVNEDVVLVIGGKGPEEYSLKMLADKLNLSRNIIFAGYINEIDLPRYFAMADIFVFSSPSETFGIVLVQAMASGKPIVAMNYSAIPEVVDDYLTGLLVKSLQPKDFAEKVIELLNSPNLSEVISKNGRKKAVEKYNWDVIVQEYDQLFKYLVHK